MLELFSVCSEAVKLCCSIWQPEKKNKAEKNVPAKQIAAFRPDLLFRRKVALFFFFCIVDAVFLNTLPERRYTIFLGMILLLGFLTCLLSAGIFVSCIVDWAHGKVVPGWTTTVASTCLIGGMMLLSQGIIGEYIGKIYMESKGRPRYIIDAMILREEEDGEETDDGKN